MTRSDKFLVIALGVFVLIMGSLIFILPQKNFSEKENRYLSKIPSFSVRKVMNGSYAKEMSDFYTDQFPLRNIATSIYALSERCMGKKNVGGVICCKEQLIAIPKKEVTKKELPIPSIYVDSKYALFKEQDGKLSLYYNTDHHRTTHGAYELYTKACEIFEIEPYSESYFKKEHASALFYGTSFFRSRLPKFAVTADVIELWRYDGDEEVILTVHDTKTDSSGFYDFSKLDTADKYAVFLGGNYAHATLFSSDDKPTLLLFKDSFANAVIPFLALHFNIEIVDPRYASKSQISEVYYSKAYDMCLFIGCTESFN